MTDHAPDSGRTEPLHPPEDALTPEASRVTNHLASMPEIAHAVVTRKMAREIILSCDGQLMLAGSLYEIVTTPAGAGLLRITTRRWKS